MIKKISFILAFMVILSCSTKDKNILLNQQVTCSSEFNEYKASNLVDTSEATSWNAGAAGLQSFCINLDKAYTVNKILVSMTSDPQALVSYKILIKKGSNGVYETVYSNSKLINLQDTIMFENKLDNVSSIQMHIDNPNSWVCVKDIKAFGH